MDTKLLDPTAILADLRTTTLPASVRCYSAVGSTMDVARELLPTLAVRQLPLLVQADEQTAGRGRQGRTWVAPRGSALLLSLALRPTWLAPPRATALVWMAGVALCEAVAAITNVQAVLKWPNDLLVPLPQTELESAGYGKAGGILLEASGNAASIDWVIIGIGVNVSASPPLVATRYPATDLATAAGRAVSRLELLRQLLQRLDYWHAAMIAGKQRILFERWRELLHTVGRTVEVQTATGLLCGYAEAVEDDGTLCVRDAAGILHRVHSGDVGL